jgi:hypothetical protein
MKLLYVLTLIFIHTFQYVKCYHEHVNAKIHWSNKHNENIGSHCSTVYPTRAVTNYHVVRTKRQVNVRSINDGLLICIYNRQVKTIPYPGHHVSSMDLKEQCIRKQRLNFPESNSVLNCGYI